MVINGEARARPVPLAMHLQRTDTNERVSVLEIWGCASENLYDALREIHDIGKGARSERTLYHANIDWRIDEQMNDEQKNIAVRRLAEKLRMQDQPRVVVEHVKDGREHLHVVFGRIDLNTMTAIPDSHNFRKHEEIAAELEKEFGHERTRRALTRDKEKEERPPQAPKFSEYQQHGRSGLTPQEAKAIVSAAWQKTDTGREFQQALEDEGFTLARGDKRDFVLIDAAGELHGLNRRIEGAKAKDVRERMADIDADQLPDVTEARRQLHLRKLALEMEGGQEFTSATGRVENDQQERPARSSFEQDAGAAVWQLRETMAIELAGVIIAPDRRNADKTAGRIMRETETFEDKWVRELAQQKATNLARQIEATGGEDQQEDDRSRLWMAQYDGYGALSDHLKESASRSYAKWATEKPDLAKRYDLDAYVEYSQKQEAIRRRSLTEPLQLQSTDTSQAQPRRGFWQRVFGRKEEQPSKTLPDAQRDQERERDDFQGIEVAGALSEVTLRPSQKVENQIDPRKRSKEEERPRPSFHLFVQIFGAIIEAYQHALDRHNIERARVEADKRMAWREHADEVKAAAPQQTREPATIAPAGEATRQTTDEQKRRDELAKALRELRAREDREDEDRERQLKI